MATRRPSEQAAELSGPRAARVILGFSALAWIALFGAMYPLL